MPSARIISYDIFRGILLLGMVVFHVLVNLTPLKFNHMLFYWVPMGFVMFLGVILEQFMQGKSKKKVALGLKLLLIFLVLNIPNFLQKDFSFAAFIGGDQRVFSFEILFPMSLLIFLSVPFDAEKNDWKILLACSFILLILLNYFGVQYYNLSFLLYGLLGYFLSLGVNIDELAKRFARWPYMLPCVFIVVCPFLYIYYRGLFDILLIFQLLAMYFLSVLLIKNSKALVWLGRHSLVLYVTHIFAIRLLIVFIS